MGPVTDTSTSSSNMPVEIIGLGKDEVRFVWDDESEATWPARALRLRCVCAMCRSETTGERILDESAVPEQVTVTDMALVGNYGVNIHFSDGHTTGIYKFRDLRAGVPQ
jgi:ATP-binding protein involved in chromosome partitioning